MRAKYRAVVLALAMGTATVPGGAAGQAKDPKASADTATAIVVMKGEFWQPAPSMKSAYKLSLSRYDPVEQKLMGGPFSGVLIEARKKNFADGYLMQSIKPGRWIISSYSQQDKWALCFNAQSYQFEVKPGEVVYLGELDAARHRDQLTEQALRSGKASVRSDSFADFFDLVEGPRLAPVDETQLAGVRAMLARTAPQVTGPVTAAQYSPGQFGTGSTLFGQRRCGGYFSKGAKKKD